MKVVCVAFFVALAIAEISAGSGYYIPRAFYTIDQNGQPSSLYPFGDEHQKVLSRFRRSPQVHSSSSSSSSSSYSSSDGGPVYFAQENAVHASGPGLGSRFGGEESGGGYYTQTSGVVDSHGKVHYNTRSGRF